MGYDCRPGEDESLQPFEGVIERLARRLACWQAPVEDLRQEGRLGALKAVRSWDEGFRCSLATWVYHCARGEMLHCRRDQMRSTRGGCIEGEDLIESDFADEAAGRVWAERLLGRLSVRRRQALALRCEGLAYVDIGGAMGIHPMAARNYVLLGAAQLREMEERGRS